MQWRQVTELELRRLQVYETSASSTCSKKANQKNILSAWKFRNKNYDCFVPCSTCYFCADLNWCFDFRFIIMLRNLLKPVLGSGFILTFLLLIVHQDNSVRNSISMRIRSAASGLRLNATKQQDNEKIIATVHHDVTTPSSENAIINWDWSLIQSRRLKIKNKICKNIYHKSPPSPLNETSLQNADFDTTYYNEDFNFFVSAGWMVGSTNWRFAMRDLYQKTTYHRLKRKTTIVDSDIVFSSLTGEDFDDSIEPYFKAIFVRHPFSRLLSVYRNIILDRSLGGYREKAKEMIRWFRRRATNHQVEFDNPTFREFARYVAMKWRGAHEMHPYWQPISVRLKPCLIPYDFIGKMETIDKDTDHLFDMLQVSELMSLPNTTITAHSRQADGDKNGSYVNVLKDYYATLPKEAFQKLVKLYEADFRIFGYPIPRNQSDFSEKGLIGI